MVSEDVFIVFIVRMALIVMLRLGGMRIGGRGHVSLRCAVNLFALLGNEPFSQEQEDFEILLVSNFASAKSVEKSTAGKSFFPRLSCVRIASSSRSVHLIFKKENDKGQIQEEEHEAAETRRRRNERKKEKKKKKRKKRERKLHSAHPPNKRKDGADRQAAKRAA